MYRKMEEEIENLTEQVDEQAGQHSGAQRLMTDPGVGPVTALATEVFLGDPGRFADGKALVAGRSSKVVQPVRGCQKRRLVRIVTGRLISLPALPE
jgi:transposase